MLINYDSCPILSFLCVETEGTDFYQQNKYFLAVQDSSIGDIVTQWVRLLISATEQSRADSDLDLGLG